MKFVISSEELRKIINESVLDTMNEAGAPIPVGGGMPKPVGGGAPKPIGGAPKPVGGGMPKPVGGGMPKPVGSGAPSPVASSDQGNAEQSNASQADTSGGVDKNGHHKPGILTAKYEPFYETVDPTQANQEVFKIWLTYINSQACAKFVSLLNQKYGNVIFAPQPLHDKTCQIPKNLKKGDGSNVESGFDKYWVKIVVRPGKMDEFIKEVPNIVDDLYGIFDTMFSKPKKKSPFGGSFQGNAGKITYDPSYKQTFVQYIIDFVNKTPTPEEVQTVNMKIAQNVKELLSHLNDPEVQRKIGMLRMIVASPTRKQLKNFLQNKSLADENGKLAGWLMSERNAIRVLAQMPNATYIAQEHVWRSWGHEVIDPTNFVLVNMPTSWKTHNENAFDRACKDFGFAGGAADYRYKKKTGAISLSPQQQAALDHLENLYNPEKTSFGYFKFYDISNTRVIQGAESSFLPGDHQSPGLADNLQGAVNAAAGGNGVFDQSAVKDNASDSNAKSVSANPEEVEMFRNALKTIVLSVTPGGPSGLGVSAERDIVLLAYHYADFLQKTQYKQMIPETAELFKKGFAAGIATSIGITDAEGANYLSTALSAQGKDASISQLAAKWFQDYYELLIDVQKEIDAAQRRASGKRQYKKVVEEDSLNESNGIRILSFDEFKNLLGINDSENDRYSIQNDVPNMQQIKESFFSFLDKMDGKYE